MPSALRDGSMDSLSERVVTRAGIGRCTMESQRAIDDPAPRPDPSDVTVGPAIGVATDRLATHETVSPLPAEAPFVTASLGSSETEPLDGSGSAPPPLVDPASAADQRANNSNQPEVPTSDVMPTPDEMRAHLAEVRAMVNEPTADRHNILDTVCSDDVVGARAHEIDQLLNDFLSTEPAPSADSVPTTEDALEAVEQAMTSLSGAVEETPAQPEAMPEAPVDAVVQPANETAPNEESVAGAASDRSVAQATEEAPTEEAPSVEAPGASVVDSPQDAGAPSTEPESAQEAQPEVQPEVGPESQSTEQSASEVESPPDLQPVAQAGSLEEAQSALSPEPVVAAAAAAAPVAAPVASSTPIASTPAASAPAQPRVSVLRRVRTGVTQITSACAWKTRSALTALADVLPAKLRTIGGLAAITLLVWVPVVWWMAKTIAANDRVRPLTEAELHHLIEASHAAAAGEAAGGHDAKGEEKSKKDSGHAEKSAEHGGDAKKPAKKEAHKEGAHKEEAKKSGGH
jgi:hypothetical protein